MRPSYFSRPVVGEYGPGFGKYIGLVPEGDVLGFLEGQLGEFLGLLAGMTEVEAMTVHAPYGWTIKQVVGHMTDCERIFGYRALRIGRNDATPLASFDENAYMEHAAFDGVPIGELVGAFELVRRGHLMLFRHFGDEAWIRVGVVNGHPATTRAFAYAIAGHAKHHLDILHKRLGK